MNRDDPRARRTRASLRAAVLDLAGERDPAALTLSAVAARAQVHRATVYLHYPDLDALLTDAMEDAVAELARAAALCPLDAPRDAAPAQLVALFEHVAARARPYARMLGTHGSPRFAVRMREALADALRDRFASGSRPDGYDDVPADVHAAYLAGALAGVIAHWLADPDSPADAALATWRLIAAPSRATRT